MTPSRPSPAAGVSLNWPGKPTGDLAAERTGPALRVNEQWLPAPESRSMGDVTLVSGNATGVLDVWPFGDQALPAAPVRLIYLDPPFATGSTFAATIPIGERRSGRPDLHLPAYRDVWAGGLPGYLTFMYALLTRLRSVLADDGWLCLHCDHRASAHLRLILDELFGSDAFRNEIVWSYGLGNGTSRRGFPRKHDTLLLYAKSDTAVFTPIRGEVSPAMASKYRHTRADGTRFMRSYGREYDLKGGKPVGSVWEIPSVAPTSGERTGYPTQKPVALLERLISATTSPGDLVLDPCGGSGTTLIAASRLERPSVGIDDSPLAIAATRSRLVHAGVPLTLATAESTGRPLSTDGEPIGGHPAGPPRQYSVSATANGDWHHEEVLSGQLTVSIDDLEITPLDKANQRWSTLIVRDSQLVQIGHDEAPVTGHWSDWLTGWAVHLGVHEPAGNAPFTPVAWAFRAGRNRTLATRLTIPLPRGSEPTHLTLRLYDLFGAGSNHPLILDADRSTTSTNP